MKKRNLKWVMTFLLTTIVGMGMSVISIMATKYMFSGGNFVLDVHSFLGTVYRQSFVADLAVFCITAIAMMLLLLLVAATAYIIAFAIYVLYKFGRELAR